MSETNGRPGWIDPAYFKNRPNFPPQELLKYKDQYIAWSYDGTRVIASDENVEQLYDRLQANGFDLARTVVSFVDTSTRI
jgi:hypothetical protein